MKFKNQLLLLMPVLLFFLVTAFYFLKKNIKHNNYNNLCKVENRGAFDIGSGATKIQIAKVKICNDEQVKIEQVYFKKNIAVKYSQDLAEGNQNIFSQKIIQEGINALHELKSEGLEHLKSKCGENCQVDVWRGITTEAFRKALNWREAQKSLASTTSGLLLKRLNQSEEALYGFYPITKLKDFNKNQHVVWDMGGGSTQITAFHSSFIEKNFSNQGAESIETDLGSSSFSHFLKKILLVTEKKKLESLNPINNYNFLEKYALKYVQNKIDFSFQSKLKKTETFSELYSNKDYVAVGGLLSISLPEAMTLIEPKFKKYDYASIQKISEVPSINKEDLQKIYQKLKKMSDSELEDFSDKMGMNKNYSKVLSSNLLLVLNYMDSSLKINKITPISIDGTDSILLSKDIYNKTYWEQDSVIN
ncbi:Ppx/GppA phosphatase family protein [Pigmentibacter ruber]